MPLTSKPLNDGVELTKLVQEAVARFNALSPKDKRAHREAQRRSWVIGEMMLAHPDMSREYAENIYDERTGY